MVTSNKKISILLSTYNGETYLADQLESLYQQSHKNTKIFVRDDGSQDGTANILQKEASSRRLHLIHSDKNLGPAASFFALLANAEKADYYAFCDQDDIWETDKLERAISKLSLCSTDIPVMYFTRLSFVNADNQFIKLSPIPQNPIGFGNALVENIATGCTVVINEAARDLLSRNLPEKCVMHDSWIYLVVSCFGQIIYDDYPSIRYRQHANNAIGTATSTFDVLARRVKRFRFKRNALFRYSDQAAMLLKLFNTEISETNKSTLIQLTAGQSSLKQRVKLIFTKSIWRQNLFDDLILRLLILFNRY